MWRALTSNWLIKLMALVLALLVWLYANNVVIKTTVIEVELGIEYPESVSVEVKPANRLVRMTLSGPAGVINELSRRKIQIAYAVDDVAETTESRSVQLTDSMVRNLPAGVRVVRFFPQKFELKVMRLAEMAFMVNDPKTVGAPARGYKAAASVLGSRKVSVRGPLTVLRRIRDELDGNVNLRPIDVSFLSEDFTVETPVESTVRFGDEPPRAIVCTDRVAVKVQFVREDVEHEIKGVRVGLRLPTGYAFTHKVVLDQDTVDLTLIGPADRIEALKADPRLTERIDAYIDVRDHKPETDKTTPFTETVIVRGLPEGVRLSKDVTVKARFEELPKKSLSSGTGTPP